MDRVHSPWWSGMNKSCTGLSDLWFSLAAIGKGSGSAPCPCVFVWK